MQFSFEKISVISPPLKNKFPIYLLLKKEKEKKTNSNPFLKIIRVLLYFKDGLLLVLYGNEKIIKIITA